MTRFLFPLLLLGCDAPDNAQLFHAVEILPEDSAADASQRVVSQIDNAKKTLHVAMPAGHDLALAGALIAAHDRGVQLEIVTDIDSAGHEGLALMLAHEPPIAITLADDEVEYFDFNINDDVSWRSDETIMSEGFVIVDGSEALVDNLLGETAPGKRLVVSLRGEELIEDLLTEHNQLFGGADATSPTQYDGPAKSIADSRWIYGTGTDAMVEMWFGPQQRLSKRLTDAVYGARGSIHVLTNDFANEGLGLALEAKAAAGFEVEVIVGPSFETSSQVLSRLFRTTTPNVTKRRIAEDVEIPTIVLIDMNKDLNGNRSTRPKGHLLSHDLYSSARLYRTDTVLNDQLIDGLLLAWSNHGEPSAELQALQEFYDAHRDMAGEFF